MLGSGRKVRFAYRCAGADSGICQCLKQGRTIVRETDWLDPRPEHLRPWQDQAACRGEDSVWFLPQEPERRGARLRREIRAKAVCGRCPVLDDCREHALRVGESSGIWGALTEDERAQILSLDATTAQRRVC